MKRLDSFTKCAVALILGNAVGWVWCSYGLAYLGRYAIAESLSQTAVEVILGTFIAYATKAAVENISKYNTRAGKTAPNANNPANRNRRDY